MPVKDIHIQGLATSTALSVYYVPGFIPPLELIKVLNRANIRFVLVGAHGIAGWTNKPRATEDVDVIVASRSHKKALAALLKEYPHLLAEDQEVVTRLRDPETTKVVVDLMKSNQAIMRAVLSNTRTVTQARHSYQIPSLEMALAMKFAAMISLSRPEEDRLIDAHDFIAVVKANPEIDLTKLVELGELVYTGGGQEVVEKVRTVRAGEKLVL